MYLQLQETALYDSLTGLPSRALFSDRFHNLLITANRNSELFVLLFIDLDGFKAVNDNFGHDAGDEVLKSVSKRMSSILRITDTVCRWGGDEFLILLPKLESKEKIIHIVEHLMTAIKENIDYKGTVCHVSASIGIACFPENGRTTDEIQKSADAAMYKAKNQGKGQAVFASNI